MINQAIAKITDEMMKKNDPLITMIEEHLTNICTNEAVASKLLIGGKNLDGCSKKIWQEAGKRKKGNGAHIPDSECFEMAEKYFEITEKDKLGTEHRNVKSSNIRESDFGNIVDILDLLK